MTRIHAWGVALGGLLLLAGCAAGTHLTREQALAQHPGLDRLETALEEARDAGVPDLAPDGFKEAQSAADAALEDARAGRAEAAESGATRGLARLTRARDDAARTRDALRDVLAMRERARTAGAGDLFASDMVAADGRLREVARLVEQGRVDEAKTRRAPLIGTYGDLELNALKKGTDKAAEAAIAHAREVGAGRLAPKTLALAEHERQVALSVLEADRGDTDKANAHARRAVRLAGRAAQIAETVKDFDRLDYTPEDIVLWYQDHLATVAAPLGGEPPFEKPDRLVVQGIHDGVAAAVKRAADLEAGLKESRADLTAAADRTRQQEARDRKDAERFDRIQALFTAKEADVFRQRRNVLIAAHGFWFPSGGSEIDAVNFALVNKIVKAIHEFPQGRVEVMGHTDAAGDDAFNLALSQDRADKVARFLVDVGGIDAARIHAQGFGETRPVATNDTQDGRAANRRVEILIVNE